MRLPDGLTGDIDGLTGDAFDLPTLEGTCGLSGPPGVPAH